MALANMKVFNEYLMEATIETLGQMVDKFNGSSNGALTLTSQGFEGDFFERSFYSALHGSKRRVDRYAANGAQSATSLAQLQEDGVKIAGGFGPILFEPAQMAWIQRSEAEAIAVISSNLAEAMVQDQLNTSIKALVSAISNQAAATNDVSASGGVNQGSLNNAHAKFGDRSGDLVAQIMNGATYHKLIGQNLTNTPQLFTAQNVTVVDILGKAVIVTDAPDLYEAGSPNKDKVLSLATGAATIYDGSDVVSNIETSNGKDRIETTMQADYDFGLALKGYTWDAANGGKSPTDAEIATGSNWDKVVTDIKHTAGVITIGDNALN
jgi:hypothetical protein